MAKSQNDDKATKSTVNKETTKGGTGKPASQSTPYGPKSGSKGSDKKGK